MNFPYRIKLSMKSRLSCLVSSLLMILGCSGRNITYELHEIYGSSMGTFYSIKIVKYPQLHPLVSYDAIKPGIEKILYRVNRQMSTYIDSSELSLFNNYRKTDWFAISDDFARVANQASKISTKSRGAFDITVGPLVNLWGFGPEERTLLIPTVQEIKTRMMLVDYQKISVQLSPPAIKKGIPEMYCDLAAIAKGFAVDRVAQYCDSLMISNYMVEIGGEIRVKGKNHQGMNWRIGVATPDTENDIKRVISLTDISIATSGDYRNYFEKDGVRYSHTIDPETGYPINHKLASVTVIHDSCMVADGLATAITVMGPEKGYNFALEQELPVFMIVKNESGYLEKMTPEFEAFLLR